MMGDNSHADTSHLLSLGNAHKFIEHDVDNDLG